MNDQLLSADTSCLPREGRTTREGADQALIYRVATVVKKLDVSRATVYRLAKAGHLKLVKVGTSASGITAESLEAHLRRIGAA